MGKKDRQTTGATIRIDRLSKRFAKVVAVDEVFLEIQKGEFITLLGPSGSGKTTILMIVAGFEKPTSGDIYINDEFMGYTPPFKRNIGMVFQNYALFPHMTVFENIAFPLGMRKLSHNEIATRVEEALELVKLQGYGDRYPKQLSGGQQQRIALARAIIFRPQVLLMDEPLGALDKKLREHMQLEIKHLHEELGLTVVYVTHDQAEALTMSDRVVVLNQGRIEQVGKPDELYDKPRNKFVADFIGETNLLEGRIVNEEGNSIRIETLGGMKISALQTEEVKGEDVSISIRPEKVILLENDQKVQNMYTGQVEEVIYVGETTKFKVALKGAGEKLFVKLHSRKGTPKPSKGDIVQVGWDNDDMIIFGH